MLKHEQAFVVAIALACCWPALAAENILGRTIPGTWVNPQGGVVSSTPGFSFTVMPVGYMGTLNANRSAPLGGQLVTGVSVNINSNFLVPQYNYKTNSSKIGLSSSAVFPVNWQGVTSSLVLDSPGGPNASRSSSVSSAGFADIFFSPLTLGIHLSEKSNLAIDAKIFAPTGAWKAGNASNLGMNEWTFMPNVTWTYMNPKEGLEFTNNAGFDIFTQNPTTKYRSGTAFHWDGLVMQYLSARFGVGGIISNITQITADTGPLADRLNGFKGRAWAAGPIVLYVMKVKNPQVAFQLRWLNEFAVSQRTNGNTLLLGLTLQM